MVQQPAPIYRGINGKTMHIFNLYIPYHYALVPLRLYALVPLCLILSSPSPHISSPPTFIDSRLTIHGRSFRSSSLCRESCVVRLLPYHNFTNISHYTGSYFNDIHPLRPRSCNLHQRIFAEFGIIQIADSLTCKIHNYYRSGFAFPYI